MSSPLAGAEVSLAIETGPTGVLTCSPVTTDGLGDATFAGCSIDTVGTYTLRATVTGTPAATAASASLTVTPGPAAKLVVTRQPSPNATAGAALATQPQVSVEDAAGNVLTGDNSTAVTATLTTPGGATLGGSATATASSGVATFSNLSIDKVGSYTLTMTSGALDPDTTGSVAIAAGSPSKLVIVRQPSSSVTAGVAFGTQPQIAVEDASGNIITTDGGTVISIDLTAANGASLGGTLTATTASGVATFANLSIAKAGTYTLTATASPLADGVTNSIVVGAAAATELVVTGFPTSATAGASHSLTVTAQDQFGNTAGGYTGKVHFTSTDGAAALPVDYTFVGGDNGVHTFTGVVLKTAGTQSITATDDPTSSITGSETGITVGAAAAASLVVAGYPGSTVAGVSHTFTVTAKDTYGNTASGYTGTVHFTSTDGAAGLPTNYAFVGGDNGVHTFSATLQTAGSRAIIAADAGNGLITGTQSGITVSAASLNKLVVTGFPASATAGVAHDVTVTAEDAFGNTITGYAGTVQFTSTDAQAVLPSDYTFLGGDAGTHAFFGGVTLKTVGSRSITATDTVATLVAGSQVGITVTPAAASTLAVSGFPGTTTAGVAQSFTVTARDPFGNTATGYTGTVHFTSNDGQATLPANYAFTGPDAGTKSFSATLKTAGSRAITATDTGNGTITGSQTGITVVPAAAASLQVTGFPDPTVAGTSHSFTVTALDAYGNTATGYTGTVHFTSTDGQVVLPSNYAFQAGDLGTQSFSATLKTAGDQTLTATDTVASSVTGHQSAITVNPAGAATLVLSAFPGSTTAGVTHSLTVTAKDAYGNTATGYTGTVGFSSTDPIATLPANYAFVGGDSGAHTFAGVALKRVGSQAITATDTVASSITGTTSAITVTPAAATTLAVSGAADPVVAGVATGVTVTAKDAFGNTATAYTGRIHFTSTDAQAVLPLNYTFTGPDGGIHSFAGGVTLKTAGDQVVTATDTVTVSITGQQTGITVSAAAANRLVVSGFTDPTTAGASHLVTITAKDPFGNTATGYTGTVALSSSDVQADLAAAHTFTGPEAGTTTLSVTLKTAGEQTISATDNVTGSITGSQSAITVNAAAATKLAVAGFPSPALAGASGSFTVTARDSFGNTDPTYTGTVHFTSSDVAAAVVLPGDYTFTGGNAGSHSFSAKLVTAATQSIAATDTVTGTITGTQSGIVVEPATAAWSLVITGYPASTTAGVQHTLTVTAKDLYGNIATGYTGTVSISSSDGQAVLPTPVTFGAGDLGVHTFDATLKTAGAQSLTASDTLLTSSPFNVTVNADVVASLQVGGFADPTVAGVAHDVTVTAKDRFGNTATGYAGTVTFSSSDTDPSVLLPGDYTFQAGDSGTHTFAGGATLVTAGTQSITASDGTYSASQSAIAVDPAAATSLTVSGYPTPVTAGVSHNFTVTAKDQYGNTATGYTGTVHFTSTDGQAALPADSTVAGGVGGFSATLKTAGSRAITAADTVTPSIAGSQAAITVNPAAPATLAMSSGSGQTATVGAAFASPLVASVTDAFANPVPGVGVTFTAPATGARATLAGSPATTDANGRASVAPTAGTVAGVYSVTASATGVANATFGLTNLPAAASTLAVSGFPGTTTAGVPHSFTVTARDPFGNTATGYTGTVHFTSNDGQAVLPGNYAFTGPDAGTRSFSATLKTAGSRTITAADTVTPSIAGSQAGIAVTPGVATKVVVTRQPSTAAAPTDVLAVQPQFAIQDANGNVVTNYATAVTLAANSSSANLACPLNPVTAALGVATFTGCHIDTAGTWTLTASSGVLAVATTTSITETKLNQTISITSVKPVRAIVSATVKYTPRATASSGLSPVTPSISTNSSTVCSITSDVVTFLTPGNCTVVYTQAGNPKFNSATASEAISVDAPPVCPTPATVAVVMNVAKSVAAGCSDANGDKLTYNPAPTLAPAHGTATISATGTWTYTPAANYVGADTFKFAANDGYVITTVTVTLSVANHPVAAHTDLATVQPVLPSAISVLANDDPGAGDTGQPLKITSVTQPAHGHVTISGSTVIYDPTACYFSPTGVFDVFYYTVSDGLTTSTTAVAVTVARPGQKVTVPTAKTLSTVPVVDVPAVGFLGGGTLGATAPARVSWCAVTAADATLKSYRVQLSFDGGATFPTTVTTATTATAVNAALGYTATYKWRVIATDSKLRVSAASSSLATKATRFDSASAAIVYAGSWGTTARSSNYSDFTERYATSTAASATLTVTNVRLLAIVSSVASTRGSLRVWVDGVLVASSVTEKATTTGYRRLVYGRSLTPGTHTIVIKPYGNGRIDLDAILTLQ